jgi:hypothetical protein
VAPYGDPAGELKSERRIDQEEGEKRRSNALRVSRREFGVRSSGLDVQNVMMQLNTSDEPLRTLREDLPRYRPHRNLGSSCARAEQAVALSNEHFEAEPSPRSSSDLCKVNEHPASSFHAAEAPQQQPKRERASEATRGEGASELPGSALDVSLVQQALLVAVAHQLFSLVRLQLLS